MSYINRVWVAATVAMVNGHSSHGRKLKSGIDSLNIGKNRFAASGDAAGDMRPASAVLNSGLGGVVCDEKRRQPEDSLRQVMYLNCWAQS